MLAPKAMEKDVSDILPEDRELQTHDNKEK